MKNIITDDFYIYLPCYEISPKNVDILIPLSIIIYRLRKRFPEYDKKIDYYHFDMGFNRKEEIIN